MNWFKKLLITAIWISIAQTLQAQQHYNAWFRSTLSVPVGNKFKIDNEFQHRRQNGFENKNMFDKNLMFTLRSWVHYQHKEDIKFSFSPFAYFSHYKIIQKKMMKLQVGQSHNGVSACATTCVTCAETH